MVVVTTHEKLAFCKHYYYYYYYSAPGTHLLK
jgi:hypothetical protein